MGGVSVSALFPNQAPCSSLHSATLSQKIKTNFIKTNGTIKINNNKCNLRSKKVKDKAGNLGRCLVE